MTVLLHTDPQTGYFPPSVSPATANYILTAFHLPPQIVDRTERYFLLHWDTTHLVRETTTKGTLWKDGVEYWILQPTVFIGAKVKLSFRKLSCQEHGYVLVRNLLTPPQQGDTK